MIITKTTLFTKLSLFILLIISATKSQASNSKCGILGLAVGACVLYVSQSIDFNLDIADLTPGLQPDGTYIYNGKKYKDYLVISQELAFKKEQEKLRELKQILEGKISRGEATLLEKLRYKLNIYTL